MIATHDQNVICLWRRARGHRWCSSDCGRSCGAGGQQRTFASPEEAVKTLIDTVKAGDLDALLAIFGPDGKELDRLLRSGDRAPEPQVFSVAARSSGVSRTTAPNRKTLVIGNEDWPFPVPLVKEASGWRFDTAAGKEEVLARRIGRNELAAIETLPRLRHRAAALRAQGHDGKPPGVYATKFRSDPGKENGLYWPAARGQKRSPLGDLVAQAAEEGRPLSGNRAQPSPFHGYYFKILTAQGAAAPGGAKNYVVKGDMSGGFALVAWPAHTTSPGS